MPIGLKGGGGGQEQKAKIKVRIPAGVLQKQSANPTSCSLLLCQRSAHRPAAPLSAAAAAAAAAAAVSLSFHLSPHHLSFLTLSLPSYLSHLLSSSHLHHFHPDSIDSPATTTSILQALIPIIVIISSSIHNDSGRLLCCALLCALFCSPFTIVPRTGFHRI